MKSILAKIFGVLCILFALLVTTVDALTFFFPIGNFILQWDSNPDTAMQKFQMIMIVWTVIGLLPIVLGLIAYYLADGIGNNWFSVILFGSFLFASLLLPIILVINTFLVPLDMQKLTGLLVILLGLYIFISPIIFGGTALVAQKVSLWKRFVPIGAFILYFVSFGIVGAVLFLIGAITKSSMLYEGAQEATIPQFLMLGSIAWGLLGIVAFFKNKQTSKTESNLPPAPTEHRI